MVIISKVELIIKLLKEKIFEDKSYKFLGMEFKDLFNKYYLTSTEFKQKKDELIEKKGIDEAKNFEQFSKSFIEDYQY